MVSVCVAILKDFFHDAHHSGRSEIAREHRMDCRAALNRLLRHLMVDRVFVIEGGNLLRVVPVECLNPALHQLARPHGVGARYCAGAPIATGLTGEPEFPCARSGRMTVHDSHTLSFASAPRLAFWI